MASVNVLRPLPKEQILKWYTLEGNGIDPKRRESFTDLGKNRIQSSFDDVRNEKKKSRNYLQFFTQGRINEGQSFSILVLPRLKFKYRRKRVLLV